MILMIIYLDMRRKLCVSYPCFTLKNESPSPNQPRRRPGDLETLKQRGGANLVCDFEFLFGPVDAHRNHFGTSLLIGITLICWGLWRLTNRWSFCAKYIFSILFFEMLRDIQPRLRSVSWRLCNLGRWRTPKMNHTERHVYLSCSYH